MNGNVWLSYLNILMSYFPDFKSPLLDKWTRFLSCCLLIYHILSVRFPKVITSTHQTYHKQSNETALALVSLSGLGLYYPFSKKL